MKSVDNRAAQVQSAPCSKGPLYANHFLFRLHPRVFLSNGLATPAQKLGLFDTGTGMKNRTIDSFHDKALFHLNSDNLYLKPGEVMLPARWQLLQQLHPSAQHSPADEITVTYRSTV